MGSDGHGDSAVESAIFQWLFSGRFGKLNCTLVRGKGIGSVAKRFGSSGTWLRCAVNSAGLAIGLPMTSFLVVEWDLDVTA